MDKWHFYDTSSLLLRLSSLSVSSTYTKRTQIHLQETKIFFSLEKIPRFCVRQGKLAYRGKDNGGKPIFIQKRIDLLLGLDLGSLVSTRKVDEVAIVAGDSDFIPVVEFAKKEGVIVWLIHGPFGTYHKDLWQATDERKEITQEIVNNVISLSANNNEKTAI
jgi:uncharacterized LabA/DUF88 family protein